MSQPPCPRRTAPGTALSALCLALGLVAFGADVSLAVGAAAESTRPAEADPQSFIGTAPRPPLDATPITSFESAGADATPN